MPVEVMRGSSAAIIADQTVSFGGLIVTLSGGNVGRLGSEGVVVQAPSAKVTTIPLSQTSFVSASDKLTKSANIEAATKWHELPIVECCIY